MFENQTPTQKAVILQPNITGPSPANVKAKRRSIDAMIEEICGLARAIELEIIAVKTFNIAQIQSGAFFGKGQREIVADICEELEPEIVIVNHSLSPVQQRNLEKAFKAKVIDRTGLILEIFGARAQTKEGRLQVELAALDYQRSRLVRSWTHLERQRGGVGFMGGPGESQIELDRRLIADRIKKIELQLEKVVRTRDLHRQKRKDVPYPMVALVGYTNAGKSTLFNRLTGSDVMAKDMLFATLDPTIRAVDLPSGTRIMLSDTVGFISNLPTELVAAFRATLEEVLAADVIVHVRDMADTDSAAHKEDVMGVLKKLFDGDESFTQRLIEVHNKMDLLPTEAMGDDEKGVESIRCSAITGEGLNQLCEVLDTRLVEHASKTLDVHLPPHAGKARAWIFRHGEVLEDRIADDGSQYVNARLQPADYDKFFQLYSGDLS